MIFLKSSRWFDYLTSDNQAKHVIKAQKQEVLSFNARDNASHLPVENKKEKDVQQFYGAGGPSTTVGSLPITTSVTS